MKQKDILTLSVIVIVSAILSIVISNYIFNTPSDRSQQVTVVGPITSNFTKPSSTYFNINSIDPTQTINVNINSNQTPFNTTTNQ